MDNLSQLCHVFQRILIIFPMMCTYGLALSSSDSSLSIPRDVVSVFLDLPFRHACRGCDEDYIKQEVRFVNYVRDRADAQVHLLVTTQATGSGGVAHSVTFIGQGPSSGTNDTLVYNSTKSESDETARIGLLNVIKLGLVRYVARTPLASNLSVTYSAPKQNSDAEVADRWNYWVFSLSGRTFVNGEQSSSSNSYSGSVSATRITSDSKLKFSARINYFESSYEYDTFSFKSVSRNKNANVMAVVSLGDHLSIGGFASIQTSTYNNINRSVSIAPAAEYNLFPYSESTRRQLRFLYKVDVSSAVYEEETIYDKLREYLVSEELSLTLVQKEPWGSTSVSMNGSHYFHDANRYNLGIDGSVSFRLIEGLSLDLFGEYSRPHDQLSLPKQDVSQEDLLLRRRELETQYRYFVSVGLSYSFGSIYNNIVNPRFGRND